jgi:DoxX-like family
MTPINVADPPSGHHPLLLCPPLRALTVFVALVMAFAGSLFLLRVDASLTVLHHLGYPAYFATLVGLTRLMGALAFVLPVPAGLREWAYTGLTLDMAIVIFSVLSSGSRASPSFSRRSCSAPSKGATSPGACGEPPRQQRRGPEPCFRREWPVRRGPLASPGWPS